jgi:methylenetetrahydrofolate reductase (NADPH)
MQEIGIFADHPPIVELLTPRQNQEDFEEALSRFAERYRRILDSGGVAAVPDNPMGHLHFSALEVLSYLDLPIPPRRLVVHLNTFHRKQDLDELLAGARALGVRYLLCVSGDGSPRLSRLEPAELGVCGRAVTSVELLAYIRSRYPDDFTLGVAYNPYEPRDHERAKLERKVEAGARFLITQPIVGRDPQVETLSGCGLPVYLGAWMSRKVHLLYECVGRSVDEQEVARYDPEANLRELQRLYPCHGLYFSLLSFRKEWTGLLPARGAKAAGEVA